MHRAPRPQPPDGPSEPSSFWFGPFQLDVGARRLSRDGGILTVSSKAFDILTVLVRRAGHTVTKNELMDLVWPGVFVDEMNLAQHVSVLRKLLGDSTKTPSFIATMPRQGYQFVAAVTTTAPDGVAIESLAPRAGRWRLAVALLGLAAALASIVIWTGRGEVRSDSLGSTHPEAGQAFTRGRYLIRQGSKQGLPGAVEELETAVRLDPAFARAHAELANAYVTMFTSRLLPHVEAVERAQSAASTALALAPDLSEAHLAQGAVYLQLGGGFGQAEPELRLAVDLDSSNALAFDLLARGLRHAGRLGESIEAARHALAIEPDSVRYHTLLARSLFFAGQDLDEARALCRKAIDLDRASTNALELAADIEETYANLDAAVAAWAEFERRLETGLAGTLEQDREVFGAAAALVRYRQAKLERLDQESDPAAGFDRGRLLARLGRLDEACDAFRSTSSRAFSIGVFGLRNHPAYRALLADTRFAELEVAALLQDSVARLR